MRADVASAGGARSIVSADFNRDGWPDLAETGTHGVSVLLNAHGEHLAFAYATPVGAAPFDLTTGDFNRDGIPDLAVANADSDSISILIGRGDGRFTRSDISTAPYRGPRGITAGDVNGDGKLDLVYSGYESHVVQVLTGTGRGGFAKGWTFVGYAPQPQGLEAADFNRDGHLDIAVAYHSGGGLVVWYGGDGTAFVPVAVRGDSNLNVLAAADLNGDGWLDVTAASTNTGRTAVYLGTPSGLLYERSYADVDPRGIAIADLSGDGVPDIITASRATSTVSVLPGDAAHRGSFLAHLTFPAGRGSRAVAAADFDADGRIDLATGNEYVGAATVLSNVTSFVRAAYRFGERELAAATRVATLGLEAADFNGDGKLDVVTSAGSPFNPYGIMVFFADGPDVVLPGPEAFAGFLVGDFNTDGNQDIVYLANQVGGIENPSAYLLTYLGDGHGGFVAMALATLSTSVTACVTGDMDRDARLDLICAGRDGVQRSTVLSVLKGNGNGTFHEGPRVVLLADAQGAAPQDLQVADVNRDGSPDVVVLNRDCCDGGDFLEAWLGNGSGGLSSGGRIESMLEESFWSFPQCLRIGDLDRDGYLDLVVYRGEGQLGIALGTASGFGSVSEVWRDFEVRYPSRTSVGLADIDMDGALDIITPLGWILPGRGDGTFGAAARFAFMGQSVLVTDVTRDGLPDILHTPLIDDSDEPPPVEPFNGVRVLVNQRGDVNRPPVVSASDRTWDYQDLWGRGCPWVRANAIDPDQHAVTFEWRDTQGTVAPIWSAFNPSTAYLCDAAPGSYHLEVTARDGRGAQTTRAVALTLLPGNEIVLYPADDYSWMTGTWVRVSDPTAAGGFRAHDPNLGAAKVTVPATTGNTIVIQFAPDPALTYKLWVRLKAEKNHWANDSVWVQFSDSTDQAGTPAYRIGTSSGLAVNLEECANCGVAGWGWEDDGWGAVNTNGVRLRFPESNAFSTSYIYIETREDGVSVDQVVLSAEKYLTVRPGAAKNDTTILKRTFPVRDQ